MRRTSCHVRTSTFEEVAEPLGRGDQQLPAVGDHAAEIIRQAAIGERHVAAPLEDEDLRVLIHAAEPSSTRAPPATPPTISTRLLGMGVRGQGAGGRGHKLFYHRPASCGSRASPPASDSD